MTLALILSNDWELFGDGSGDFFDVQLKPALEILELLPKYNAKMTWMAEVGQQWAFQKIATPNSTEEKIVLAWEDLLRKTISEGSDVQLHYHPQWMNSHFDNEKWQLYMEHWALSSLTPEQIEDVLRKGKSYLESILKVVNPDYRCIAFRAGAYCIQPEAVIISKLIESGFLADTSVTKGYKGNGYYDFTSAESNIIPWFVREDNINWKNSQNKGLLELPIYSMRKFDSTGMKKFVPFLHKALFQRVKIPPHEQKWQKEREHFKNLRYPRENRFYKQYSGKDLSFYLSAILSMQTYQLDYDYLPASLFVNILKEIYDDIRLQKYVSGYDYLPVVASGHVKDIHNADNLKWILELAGNEMGTSIEYWTMSQAVNYWLDILKDKK